MNMVGDTDAYSCMVLFQQSYGMYGHTLKR